jgi:Zn-dependent protease
MPTLRSGAIHLFKLAGIDVYLHWWWFLAAAYFLQRAQGQYGSIVWSVLEYLALFLIVLTHEFGHALACRQVGGDANQIVLWPLGGVAYVNPPQRPGAMLWSIAAGPLVNVVLLPVLYFANSLTAGMSLDVQNLVNAVFWINVLLLCFNILPVYPLDGGQILRSLLWFPLGRARSLMVATVVGFIGIVAFIGLALYSRSVWYLLMSAYLLMNCWSGLKQARALLKIAKLPRREGFACPSCHTAPPIGAYWLCRNCNQPFDTFATGGVCSHCGARFEEATCLDCRRQFPMSQWIPGNLHNASATNPGFHPN